MRGFGVEDFLGLRIRVGIGHFVGHHFNRRDVARRDAHVAARILYLDIGVGGNLRVQHLRVKVVFGQAESVEEIVIQAEINTSIVKPRPRMIPSCGGKSQNGQQDEQADKAAATAHRDLPAQIQHPLAHQQQAGADQQQRPPVAIPCPELICGDVAGHQHQRDHADADQEDGADKRGNPRAVNAHIVGLYRVALRLPCLALGTPCGLLLLPVDPPLGLGIIGRIWGWRAAPRRRARWHIRRCGAHNCPPMESLLDSCCLSGEM